MLDHIDLSDKTTRNFSNAQFTDTISFAYNSIIPHEIEWLVANFSNRNKRKKDAAKPIMINLYRTDIAKIHLDYIHFKFFFPDLIPSERDIKELKDGKQMPEVDSHMRPIISKNIITDEGKYI